MHGVDIPHDCRSGYCGTCRVNVVKGRVFGGEDGDANVVRACQSRVISDLAVEIEDVPPAAIENGHVAELVRLAPTSSRSAIADAAPGRFSPPALQHAIPVVSRRNTSPDVPGRRPP